MFNENNLAIYTPRIDSYLLNDENEVLIVCSVLGLESENSIDVLCDGKIICIQQGGKAFLKQEISESGNRALAISSSVHIVEVSPDGDYSVLHPHAHLVLES